MARGSFQIHIVDDKLWAQWGTGDVFLIGKVPPKGKKKMPSLAVMKAKRAKLLQLYESFHKMSYEIAVENMRNALYYI